ncbi:hypothetical protein LCGC14_1062320 [marine sediment metagenome]|uniref:Uncharacterized protein n=1 Tax=marine sediment metagenome TaxID=412755 RepID=A0A0F9N7S1_9ZZZZ
MMFKDYLTFKKWLHKAGLLETWNFVRIAPENKNDWIRISK